MVHPAVARQLEERNLHSHLASHVSVDHTDKPEVAGSSRHRVNVHNLDMT